MFCGFNSDGSVGLAKEVPPKLFESVNMMISFDAIA
jgi:hypothetical protein